MSGYHYYCPHCGATKSGDEDVCPKCHLSSIAKLHSAYYDTEIYRIRSLEKYRDPFHWQEFFEEDNHINPVRESTPIITSGYTAPKTNTEKDTNKQKAKPSKLEYTVTIILCLIALVGVVILVYACFSAGLAGVIFGIITIGLFIYGIVNVFQGMKP